MWFKYTGSNSFEIILYFPPQQFQNMRSTLLSSSPPIRTRKLFKRLGYILVKALQNPVDLFRESRSPDIFCFKFTPYHCTDLHHHFFLSLHDHLWYFLNLLGKITESAVYNSLAGKCYGSSQGARMQNKNHTWQSKREREAVHEKSGLSFFLPSLSLF